MDDDDRTGEATLCGCGEEDYETKEREQNESRVLGFYSWLVFLFIQYSMDVSLSCRAGFSGSGETGYKEYSSYSVPLRPQFPVLWYPRYGLEGK